MTDLQKIAKRVLRMIEAGETSQDVFVRDSGTLAEMVLDREEQCERDFSHLTDGEIIKLVDLINDEKLIKTIEV